MVGVTTWIFHGVNLRETLHPLSKCKGTQFSDNIGGLCPEKPVNIR